LSLHDSAHPAAHIKKTVWELKFQALNHPSYSPYHACSEFNLLKTKCNLLYIRNQTVPRCKHFPLRLLKLISQWYITQRSLYVLRSVQNT